jgi:hypothetical protein
MVTFAMRAYREHYLEGTISWSRAFMFGLDVWFFASLVEVVGVKLFSAIIMPDFWDLLNQMIDGPRHDGLSNKTIYESLRPVFDHPLFYRWALPFVKFFLIGFVMSPISALLGRRKPVAAVAPIAAQ